VASILPTLDAAWMYAAQDAVTANKRKPRLGETGLSIGEAKGGDRALHE
jgi:hypothetical protein